MNIKNFTSQNGWFTLTIPEYWEEYDDGDEDTYSFFNTMKWSGNFRITSFRWLDIEDPNEDKAAQYISDELTEYNQAIKLKIGNLECAYYKKDFQQENKNLLIYYWTTGTKNDLFLCSFTIDKNQEQTEENKKELQIVLDIIKSIKIN